MQKRQQLANAIRALSMDAVEKAQSGHPGMPLGMADIAEVLWRDYLKHHPKNPHWVNRDRFVLSNGHGSMLLYALLHLTGYDVSIEDLKSFRQLHSKTPGHPEYHETPGVEVTTGPLGQGLGAAVGFALSERLLANTFNKPDCEIISHYTYCFAGDGCLMEGISHEVCSLAGTLGLGKLIVFWDNNHISIDGQVSQWFGDNTPMRFKAYGWHVIEDINGHNAGQIKAAIEAARTETSKPTLICCETIIGYGAPNLQGSEKSHGAPLGTEEVAKVRENLNWLYPPFEIPEEVYEAFDANTKGQALEAAWTKLWQQYEQRYPQLAQELLRRQAGELPKQFASTVKNYLESIVHLGSSKMATRKASLEMLNAVSSLLPELLGGSADLTGSNLTKHLMSEAISPHHICGNYIYYGVREFGMAAIMNGVALYGGFIPYGGTFLTFSDYARNAIRMSAIMQQRVIYIMTHDSIGLGEDGPTHQPIEHLNALRLIPNASIWRPADQLETAIAWQAALENKKGPSVLCLSRQNVGEIERDKKHITMASRGGYILIEPQEEPEAIIIATGTEVALAVQAAKELNAMGHHIRVVSMPSTNVFLAQDVGYQEKVLPNHIKARVSIEAGATGFWHRFVSQEGIIMGIDHFGFSAPANDIYQAVGLTVSHLVEKVQKVLVTCSLNQCEE